MGEMISMIAHQWRQPLNTLAIINQALVLKHRRGKIDDDIIEDFKKDSNNQIKQMSATIDDFRNFFKPDKELKKLCISDVLKTTLEVASPMLVSSKEMTLEEACSKPIAIPGQKTSAHLALKMACGKVETVIVPFDEIMPRIQNGEFNSGVIIHEGQLTWKSHGMNLLLDLGIWWNERNNGLPLPLGGNVVRKNLGKELCEDITEWVKQSIEIAISNPDEALEFARQWGRGIDEETNSKFVQMYVNSRTIDFGDDGRESIIKFLTEGQEIGMINPDFDPSSIEFIGA